MSKRFFDTNVVVYLAEGGAKAKKCEALIERGGVISVQVLNETVNVLRKKTDMSFEEIAVFLAVVRQVCQVDALTLETHNKAIALAQKYQFSWFDALIVASAIGAQCTECWSEDMHNGLVVEKTLTIRDPFSVLD